MNYYRTKAAELAVQFKTELDPKIRAEIQTMALSYLHLAERAERDDAPEAASITRQTIA